MPFYYLSSSSSLPHAGIWRRREMGVELQDVLKTPKLLSISQSCNPLNPRNHPLQSQMLPHPHSRTPVHGASPERDSTSKVSIIPWEITKLRRTPSHFFIFLLLSFSCTLNVLHIINDTTAAALGYGITKANLPEANNPKATSSKEKFSHIDEKDKQSIVEKVAVTQKWLEDMTVQQMEREKFRDPVLTTAEISKKRDEVIYFATLILTKPKPKPPVVPTPTGSGAQMPKTEPEPEAKKEAPGPSEMDVD
ncbi:hypothetical protein C8J55DRAFT_557978 [Lentinula edodes]|uniref:Uncharacterized protein n=1 Tax=Lentinula lateritia TaxID=40482 RepID=A0A9W9ARQ0_9AGAR|nr:hypothetical protein C8J55DRAFT_557978 [Lentinula edodes]